MKRINLLFIFTVILTGCASTNFIEDANSSSSIEDQVQISSELDLTSNVKDSQKKSQEKKDSLTFVPQLDEINQGLTIENDKALSNMQKIVAENQNIGIEDDVTIVYSGETFGDSPNLAGIFLIINRTNQALENIKFTYTFGGVDKNLIFDQKAYHLTEERFGVLQPNTVMPMYFIVKPENEKDLKDIDVEQVIEKIESFDYDVASEDENNNNTEKKESKSDGLIFKLPKQNDDNGQTVENNPLMMKFKEIVDNTENLGFNNDVTVLYSKLHDKNEKDMIAYFLVINRTDTSMKDIRFNFNYGNTNGEMVWENEPYYMSNEVFGILEPMTVLPVTLTVPEGKERLFLSITDDNVKTSIEKFNYNEAN